MDKITYTLQIGNWSVDSADDPRTELVELDTLQSLESPLDACRVVLYAPPAPQPGLLEQAAGAAMGALGLGAGGGQGPAFSVQVRGETIEPGDALSVELTAGDRTGKVLTAEVQAVETTLGLISILGRLGMQKLAETRLNQVYENQSLAQIVRDLADQTGIQTGDVETGQTYTYFVVHESRSVLRCIRELVQREGLELYFDPENRLVIKKFNKTRPDHTFYFGIDLLDIHLLRLQPGSERVRVDGESPASSQGSDSWHWLAKDLSPFQGEVGQGDRLIALQDGALRTKDAAGALASARLGVVLDRSARGRLKLLGNPAVKLGDAIEVKNAPKPGLNGLFKIVSVRHRISKREGYLTWIEFTGQGGAQQAEGLLGQLGALAGGIGL